MAKLFAASTGIDSRTTVLRAVMKASDVCVIWLCLSLECLFSYEKETLRRR